MGDFDYFKGLNGLCNLSQNPANQADLSRLSQIQNDLLNQQALSQYISLYQQGMLQNSFGNLAQKDYTLAQKDLATLNIGKIIKKELTNIQWLDQRVDEICVRL